MNDFAWVADERVLDALRPARAPASWLARLGGAVASLDGLARAVALLNPLLCAPPLADTNPLAALSGAITGPVGNQRDAGLEDVGARAAPATGQDDTGSHRSARRTSLRAPSSRQTSVEARPSTRAPLAALAAPNMPGDRPQAHSSSQGASPTNQPALANTQGNQAQARQPLPVGEQRTLSGRQLGAIAGVRAASGASSQAKATSQPAAHDRAGAEPEARPVAQTSRASSARWPIRAGAAPGSPSVVARAAEAGAALLARLAQAPDVAPNGAPTSAPAAARARPQAASASELLRPVLARAFGTVLGRETLPIGQLTALAAPRQRAPDARAGRAGPSTDLDERGAHMPAQRQARLAPPTSAQAMAGQEGLALLRDSLDRQPPPVAPVAPASASRSALRRSDAIAEQRPESPAAPDHAAREPVALATAPAVQNTFNVTVHMAGGLDSGEEELAERLNRLLVEQARRYGIDV
jgi:hypothetical protein